MTVTSEYLATLHPPDLTEAQRLCSGSIEGDGNPAIIVDNVLAPAQIEVGRRWHANEWTVAQEHAATAVTDAVLASIALDIPPSTQPGLVVTGCAEGEWHTLPVRMLNVSLAAAGYEVVTLGPSLPPAQLGPYLADLDPVALLLNCTMPTNLAGAARTIDAAHAAGVPVLAGGRAFGASSNRAQAIGADGWAKAADTAGSFLRSWTAESPPPPESTPQHLEQADLEHPSTGLIDDCLQELVDDVPTLATMTDVQTARTREDISYILQFCGAAILTEDPSVLDDFTVWLVELLAPRHVPARTIEMSYRAIASVLGGGYPATVALLDASGKLISETA